MSHCEVPKKQLCLVVFLSRLRDCSLVLTRQVSILTNGFSFLIFFFVVVSSQRYLSSATKLVISNISLRLCVS